MVKRPPRISRDGHGQHAPNKGLRRNDAARELIRRWMSSSFFGSFTMVSKEDTIDACHTDYEIILCRTSVGQ